MVSAGSKRVRAAEIIQAKKEVDCGGIPKFEPGLDEQADGSLSDKDITKEMSTILQAMNQYKEKATSDVKLKNETVIQRAQEQIKSILDGEKSKNDKEMQAFNKDILKTCKEAEASMKHEASEFQTIYDRFCSERNSYRKNYEELVTKFEKQMEAHRAKLEHQKKKGKAVCEKAEDRCMSIITEAEVAVKKRKQQEKSLSMLRKSINDMFESASDDEETDLL